MRRFLLFAATVSLVACSQAPTEPQDAVTPPPSTTGNDTQWDGQLLEGKHTVVLKTSKGDITLELDADVAPKTVTNFVEHAKSGYYNDITFHRTIEGFMIQGGDPEGTGMGGDSIFGPTFEDEIDASSSLYAGDYKEGEIAMANRGPNTNGSQFFIMDADYPLPPQYAKFGKVIDGQDVVHAIATAPLEPGTVDKPAEAVTFTAEVKN